MSNNMHRFTINPKIHSIQPHHLSKNTFWKRIAAADEFTILNYQFISGQPIWNIWVNCMWIEIIERIHVTVNRAHFRWAHAVRRIDTYNNSRKYSRKKDENPFELRKIFPVTLHLRRSQPVVRCYFCHYSKKHNN